MFFIKILTKLKNNYLWYLALKILIYPLYNFIWINYINKSGKTLFKKFQKKNIKPAIHIDESISCRLIRGDPEFYKIAKKIGNELNHDFIVKEINLTKQKKDLTINRNFYFNIYSNLNEEIKKEIVDFAKSERNLSIAANYLKVMPIIARISLYVNFPTEVQNERSTMLWHKDDFGFKSLDFFIPINELNLDNGAMQYAYDNDELSIFTRVPEIIQNAKPKERNKIKTIDFKKYYKEKNLKVFQGKIGDALLIDSFRVYHRGGHCNKNYRIMFRISYQTPDSIRVINSKDQLLKKLNINENNIKDDLEKHLFLGNRKFSNKEYFINFLLFFYRMVHRKKFLNHTKNTK